MIYLDNAATTWPKPPGVSEAMQACLRHVGGSPGRSGHRLSNEAERVRFAAREAVAKILGLREPLGVIFTLNATTALNMVIQGLLTPGTHAITTSMEHNSVLRPLRELEENGVRLSLAPCRSDGTMNPQDIAALLRPETRLVVVNHASNVCGTLLPIENIGAITRERGIPLLVDATQTAGGLAISMEKAAVDLLAFTGHKGLLGPGGTGGLAMGPSFDVALLPPLIRGGTGSRSEEETQPDLLPDRYEAGTPNVVGLAGLTAGIRYVLNRGVAEIRELETLLVQRLIDGLVKIPGVRVYGTLDAERQMSAVSFTVDGMETSDVAFLLNERFEVMARPGLQCAPRAHRTLGTFPTGTVRLSPGPFTTEENVDGALAAVKQLAAGSHP